MSPSGAPSIGAVVVGVPARDEADRVAECIRSIDDAAAGAGVPVRLVVVDDGSHDGTCAIAATALAACRHLDGEVLALRCGSAGTARSAAIDAALHGATDLDRTWVATTDADTVVGPTWLARQLAWAARGYGAVSGLVDVRWDDGDRHLEPRYLASLGSVGTGHDHVHGANLGLLARHWRAVGGCGDATDGEDRELWCRLRAAGVDVLGVDDLPVVTSGRLTGRAPAGFSGYLRRLAEVATDLTAQPA